MPRCGPQSPDRKFPGFTDVDDLAPGSSGYGRPVRPSINGARIPLDT